MGWCFGLQFFEEEKEAVGHYIDPGLGIDLDVTYPDMQVWRGRFAKAYSSWPESILLKLLRFSSRRVSSVLNISIVLFNWALDVSKFRICLCNLTIRFFSFKFSLWVF